MIKERGGIMSDLSRRSALGGNSYVLHRSGRAQCLIVSTAQWSVLWKLHFLRPIYFLRPYLFVVVLLGYRDALGIVVRMSSDR